MRRGRNWNDLFPIFSELLLIRCDSLTVCEVLRIVKYIPLNLLSEESNEMQRMLVKLDLSGSKIILHRSPARRSY